VPSADESPVSRRLIATGATEPHFTAIVQPGAHVVDVGANIGYFTTILAQATGPDGRVVAFEPVERLRAYLSANVEGNAFEHVTVDGRALADFDGRGYLTLPAHRLQREVRGDEQVAFEIDTPASTGWPASSASTGSTS